MRHFITFRNRFIYNTCIYVLWGEILRRWQISAPDFCQLVLLLIMRFRFALRTGILLSRVPIKRFLYFFFQKQFCSKGSHIYFPNYHISSSFIQNLKSDKQNISFSQSYWVNHFWVIGLIWKILNTISRNYCWS